MTELSATGPGAVRADYEDDVPAECIALVDLLDRVLAGGVVVAGDVTLSIADVDLVTVSLRALITSVSTLARSDANLPELQDDRAHRAFRPLAGRTQHRP
jgi:hypothetical protein